MTKKCSHHVKSCGIIRLLNLRKASTSILNNNIKRIQRKRASYFCKYLQVIDISVMETEPSVVAKVFQPLAVVWMQKYDIASTRKFKIMIKKACQSITHTYTCTHTCHYHYTGSQGMKECFILTSFVDLFLENLLNLV